MLVVASCEKVTHKKYIGYTRLGGRNEMILETSKIESKLSNDEKYSDYYFHYNLEQIKEKIQPALLKILTDFDEICKKENIYYVIVGGTLLGAVRERGFIEWDDDIDVVIKSSDLYRLRDAVRHPEYSDKYQFILPEEDKLITLDAKFMSKDITLGQLLGNPKGGHNLYLDVLLIENVPDNYLLRKIKGIVSGLLVLSFNSLRVLKSSDKLLDYISKDSKELKMNLFIRRAFAFPARIMGKARILKILRRVCNYKKDNTAKVSIPFGVKRYSGEIVSRDALCSSVPILFESMEFQAPKNYQEYLSNRYGDYLTPTSEADRNVIWFQRRDDYEEIMLKNAKDRT